MTQPRDFLALFMGSGRRARQERTSSALGRDLTMAHARINEESLG